MWGFMNLGSLLFGFQGRINRAKYWLTAVIYLAFVSVVTVLALLVDLGGLFIALAMVIYVALAISSIAVSSMRVTWPAPASRQSSPRIPEPQQTSTTKSPPRTVLATVLR